MFHIPCNYDWLSLVSTFNRALSSFLMISVFYLFCWIRYWWMFIKLNCWRVQLVFCNLLWSHIMDVLIGLHKFPMIKILCYWPCFSYIYYTYIFGQSKIVQTRGKKSGNEGEVTCDEEDTSTSELKQNEKHSEDPSGQPDIVSHDHVSALVLLWVCCYVLLYEANADH